MTDTVLQELNRRFPFTAGLKGEALGKAISIEWESLDAVDVQAAFTRMAMFVAAHETAPVESDESHEASKAILDGRRAEFGSEAL